MLLEPEDCAEGAREKDSFNSHKSDDVFLVGARLVVGVPASLSLVSHDAFMEFFLGQKAPVEPIRNC